MMNMYVELSMKDGKKSKKKKSKRGRKQQVPAEMAAEPDLAKYWAQRYRLFSRFDEGIRLDRGQSALCMHACKLPAPDETHLIHMSSSVNKQAVFKARSLVVVVLSHRGKYMADFSPN